MEKDFILNGNKLIAEFMGFNQIVNDRGIRIFQCNKSNRMFDLHGFKYHKSWDWLIPVFHKIENLMANWDRSNYNKGYKWWMSKFRGSFLNIEELYKNIVEFITWYNEQ